MNDSINSNNKAHYDKFVVNSSNPMGEGRTEEAIGKKYYGQEQFGVIGDYVEPINMDKTRNTENDDIASELITSGGLECVDDSQGGQY